MVDETGSRGKDAAYSKEGDEDMIYESAQDRYQDYEDNKKAVSPFRIGEIAPFVDENLNKLVMFSGEDRASYKRYKCLSTYKPDYGDKILLARVGGTYVILGKIGDM